MQQLKIIDHFIKKKHKSVKVVGCKTIRDRTGVAYSSRNLLLTPKQKNIASKVYKFIKRKKNFLITGRSKILKSKKEICNFGVNKIEYIKIININKLIKPYIKSDKYKIFIAYYLGRVRLIDNI